MPKYDYTCQSCETVFETRLSFAEVDTAQPACPACGSTECQRVIGRVNFILGDGGSFEAATGSGSRNCSACSSGNCSTCF